jgi:hypothetical protein
MKILLPFVISTLLFQACGTAKTGETGSVPPPDAVRAEPPFQNAEPEAYQAEVWQTNAKGTDKFYIARKGDKWRVDNGYGDPNQVTSLHNDKDYVLSFATKTYAEYQSGHGYDDRSATVEAVTMGMINGREKAIYEKTGTEGGMTKYRVTGGPGKPVESIITIDDKVGLPVVKEIYKIEGGRTLDMTVKLSGFKTEVEDTLFDIPKDFKKVPIEEMKKVLIAPK